MERMYVTCNNCSGIGHTIKWEVASEDAETGMGTMKSTKIVCEKCDGKGYTEHAVFSIEEAKAILKYCGLDKE